MAGAAELAHEDKDAVQGRMVFAIKVDYLTERWTESVFFFSLSSPRHQHLVGSRKCAERVSVRLVSANRTNEGILIISGFSSFLKTERERKST